MIEMPGVRVPGWPALSRDRQGVPRTIDWLAIEPCGELTVWTSDNVLGYAIAHDIWIQWNLMRDVYGVICPPGFRHIRHVRAIHAAQGTVLSPRRRGDDPTQWPVNGVATAMVESLDVAEPGPLYGTVAWLGELTVPGGVHVDLTEQRITDLAKLAARRLP